jgi:integrase
MSASATAHTLQARTRVLIEKRGRGTSASGIRRAYLFHAATDELLELQTTFVDHEFGAAALHTQIAVLADLAHWWEWCCLRRARNASWTLPEMRPLVGAAVLTNSEIADYASWCGFAAPDLARALHLQITSSNLRSLPTGKSVDNKHLNRRIRTVSKYLQWAIRNMVCNGSTPSREDVLACEVEARRIEKAFNKQLKAQGKYAVPKSLNQAAARQLHSQLRSVDQADSACLERDRLVLLLLLEGVRAGELLKLRTCDIDEAYKIEEDKTIAIVTVLRQPNSEEDTRLVEPAVKTLPGDLPIPKRLARQLIRYISTWRRDTLDATGCAVETPYVFICHHGPQAGMAISQRNLNRIVAKLKGVGALPASLAPHILRHTHMTEVYETGAAEGKSIQAIEETLLHRGRWSEKSSMPRHYTGRAILKESARMTEERDRKLEQGF